MTQYKFKCDYCGKPFVREANYLKHRCKEMIRHEEFDTPEGKSAWEHYQHWMKKQKRRVVSKDAFLSSRFYTPFMNFSKFVKRVSVPEPDRFIEWMIYKNYNPQIWTRDEVYRSYLEHLDRSGDPMSRAETTITTIQKLKDEYHCPFSDIFSHVPTSVIFHHLQSRHLSPWILLHSPKFWVYYKGLSEGDKTLLDILIRASFWTERFNKEVEATRAMKEMVKRLNL